jgi:hypothetical protein
VRGDPVERHAGGAGVPDCCRTVLRGPQPDWNAAQVVKGFLTASASIAHDHALAREYLTPDANKAWQPGNQVIILASEPQVSPLNRRITTPGGKVTVVVTGQKLATLSNTGQYNPTPRAGTSAPFGLVQVNGKLLIDQLPNGSPGHPTHQLLLPSDLFHIVYTPRNLYYYGVPDGGLVPDPVFVPTEDTNPATKLLNDLLNPPDGLLENAARTFFPPGIARPKLQVLPSPTGGKVAIVSFRLPSWVTSPAKLAMARQLVATLTSSAYSPELFEAVKFKINGKFWAPPATDPLLDLGSLPGSGPQQRAGAPLYYLTSGGSPRILGSHKSRGVALSAGGATLNKIAVSPGGKYFAGLAAPGTTVYTSGLATSSDSKTADHAAGLHLRAQFKGTDLTSMSWDGKNNLWIAGQRQGGYGVWLLPQGKAPAIPVTVVPGRRVGGDVTGIRMAPDGVRVAMIVGHGSHARLVLGAVVKDAPDSYTILRVVPLASGLTGVTSLSWYDEDHLLVVSAKTKSGTQTSLSEVPANGDSARPLTGLSDSVAITAAGPKNPLYLSLSTGQVEKSVGLDEPWTYIAPGRAATYPG